MKSIFLILISLIFVASTFATDANIAGDARIYSPGNVVAKKLGPCVGGSDDSIAASSANVYGPYNLSFSRTRPMYTSFRYFTDDSALISATDSLAFYYQIVGGSTINDTTSKWTIKDTITGVAADTGAVVDISGSIGGSIFFKLKNLRSADTAVVYNPIRIWFKEASETRVDGR